jgi:hypothetical protein
MGRWSAWVFPAGSASDEPGVLDGIEVPATSGARMLAMKEQFPALRNGKPWRAKDKTDVEVLRVLASESGAGTERSASRSSAARGIPDPGQ